MQPYKYIHTSEPTVKSELYIKLSTQGQDSHAKSGHSAGAAHPEMAEDRSRPSGLELARLRPARPGGVPRGARPYREPPHRHRTGAAGKRYPPARRRLRPPRARSSPARPLAHGRRNPAAAPAPQPAERVGELRSAAGAPNGAAEAALLGLRRARRRLPAGGGRALTADGRAGGRPGVGVQVGRGARRPWGTPFGQLFAHPREEASRVLERRRPVPAGTLSDLK